MEPLLRKNCKNNLGCIILQDLLHISHICPFCSIKLCRDFATNSISFSVLKYVTEARTNPSLEGYAWHRLMEKTTWSWCVCKRCSLPAYDP